MTKVEAIGMKDITEECFEVQVFGTDSCKQCTTTPCTGAHIKKTGKNEIGKIISDTGMLADEILEQSDHRPSYGRRALKHAKGVSSISTTEQ